MTSPMVLEAAQFDFWGLCEQDHIDAALEDAARFGSVVSTEVAEADAPWSPLIEREHVAAHLVMRYYGSYKAYVGALEARIAEDRAALAAAPAGVSESWRISRHLNIACCLADRRNALAKVQP